MDSPRQGRAKYLWGEGVNTNRLSASDVLRIRERIARGDRTTAIAADYGVVPATISSIKTRRNWKRLMHQTQ